MKFFEGFSWLATCFMAVFAGFRLLSLWLSSGASAPQYAAEAAGICAMVIVPYVFSRAIQSMRAISALDVPDAAPVPVKPAVPQLPS
jgi:hypothetical protein